MKSIERHPLLKKDSTIELKYSLLIFLFLSGRFLFFSHNNNIFFSPPVAVYYFPSYKLGFINKAFIGSVFSLFTDYLTNNELIIVNIIVVFFLFTLISIILGKAIGKSDSAFKPAVTIFTFLLLTAPLSFSSLIERHFGRLDIFLLIFTLLGLVCLKLPGIKWIIPVLCFAAVATHPGYLVTYMPALAIALLYEVYRNKYSKKSIILFSISCIVLISFFIYFQLFSPRINFASAEQLGSYFSKRTDMKISISVLYIEYFYKYRQLADPKLFSDLFIPMLKGTILPTIIVFTAFTFPLIIIFISVWKHSIHNADNLFLKLIFILCACAPIAFIPAAIFGQDWERWWAAAIDCQFMLIFYFIISNEKPLKDSLIHISNFFNSHFLILLCIIIFFSILMQSNICSFILKILDINIWHGFFVKVLPNYDYSLYIALH